MPRFIGSVARYPARALVTWYLILIVVGSLALASSWCRAAGAKPISLLDSVFTSTSAACVTGLTVRSTGDDFSFLGQVVILTLIQLGGLGIMTVATFVSLSWTGRESLRAQATVSETLGAEPGEGLRMVLRRVVIITLGIEAAGALLLFARLLFDHPIQHAMWHAAFLSVSAFCNAGFALDDDNLVAFQGDVPINLVVVFLVVVGGIGFPVMSDIRRNWSARWPEFWRRLRLHTKLSLVGTGGLLVFGAVMFLLLEWNNALADLSPGRRLLVSLFQSVTPRTAGFNTVDFGQLANATVFLMIVLMLIGACPCSTGGGFKVSTFMVLLLQARAKLKGAPTVGAFRRSIDAETVERSTATALLFAIIAALAFGLLLTVQEESLPYLESSGRFSEALFEVVSALGTVGLSTGYTKQLQPAAKSLIILLMFMGRVGPITLLMVLARPVSKVRLEHPKESVLIG